ncbi:hypothetical protein [Arcticibacter eurypsychrophilus]|uniref:hypothetical protein n=1 Tax=Arcticibacter eurypsychrophilus TaxID=1434752 RepID=UPI00084E028C|nr:hypothetical protein [Arcticibacter eurypsychrophilus]
MESVKQAEALAGRPIATATEEMEVLKDKLNIYRSLNWGQLKTIGTNMEANRELQKEIDTLKQRNKFLEREMLNNQGLVSLSVAVMAGKSGVEELVNRLESGEIQRFLISEKDITKEY